MNTVLPLLALLAAAPPAHFPPDPVAVRRFESAYAYPQAGWTVLHIEGEPYARGVQHGRLLAREIGEFVACVAKEQCSKAPEQAWRLTRAIVDANFLRGFDPEYLDEMKGIADGATEGGARFDGRPIDLLDIAVINCWPEVFTLGGGLEAWPTGLEGRRFPHDLNCCPPSPEADHCSAFAATGPATADGKIVFGHITMFGLYEARWFNVWLDVQPAKGHRVIMQTFPGGIQSGMDYYLNSAGMMVTETTIKQTRFDPKGIPLASRIRKALQYGSSIDEVVEYLSRGNNGLYTNEWLLGDAKTNEIAMFELGTHKSKLLRSSRGEWFGGTEGFYWGCNNTKDMEVRLESYPGVAGRPVNAVWRPGARDMAWLKLYEGHKGKIGPDFARLAYGSPPITSYSSLDAKFTTTDMAKQLKSWAIFGPPLGRTWQPERSEIQRYPDIRPLVSNPWTVLTAEPPHAAGGLQSHSPPWKGGVGGGSKLSPTNGLAVADGQSQPSPNPSLPGRGVVVKARDLPDKFDPLVVPPKALPDKTTPAWFGTLLPKTNADIWLAAAFADYEPIVALEFACRKEDGGKLSPAARQRLGVMLNGHRAGYRSVARTTGEVAVTAVRANGTDDYYRLAAGKGVLALHELRGVLGDTQFVTLMEKFGRENAGKATSTAEFVDFITEAAGQPMNGFFDYWLNQTGLPGLKFSAQPPQAEGDGFRTTGALVRDAGLPKGRVEVTVETDAEEITRSITFAGDDTPFVIATKNRPRRIVLDKYGACPAVERPAFGLQSWAGEIPETLIVFGTLDEEAANREAANELQRLIRARRNNHTVPVKADRDLTPDDWSRHHLLLVGRPSTNAASAKCADRLPVKFGRTSFTVRGATYAHPETLVVVADENPANPKWSVVVLAGLGTEATTRAADVLLRQPAGADVAILPHAGQAESFVAPGPTVAFP